MTTEPKGYATLYCPEAAVNAATIGAFLDDLVLSDPRNALPEGDNPPIVQTPVVGIASAADPLFQTLKQPGVVGEIHVDAEYWLPGAKSVISVFLPFSKAIKKSYAKASPLPSLEWVSSRQNGEVFVNVVRRGLVRYLEKQGARAAAPNLDPRYQAVDMLPMWSERHVAFIAGVGTFGLHAGLLTAKGAAGRIASVVTDLDLTPTVRTYDGIYDYCTWKTDQRCGACIKRCPAQAIDAEGKSHPVCMAHGNAHIRPAFRQWGYHSCGHCQTNLPCSDRIPKQGKRQNG